VNDRQVLPLINRGSFTYANPGLIHWSAGCVAERLTDEIDQLDGRRVFLVTTRRIAGNTNLLGPLRRLLGNHLVGIYLKVRQHTPARDVVAATAAAREARSDLLLSLGGGSAIDAAKAVAFSLVTSLNLTDPNLPSRAQDLGAMLGMLHMAW
jgi:alcohol dehydrogenase class IV